MILVVFDCACQAWYLQERIGLSFSVCPSRTICPPVINKKYCNLLPAGHRGVICEENSLLFLRLFYELQVEILQNNPMSD